MGEGAKCNFKACLGVLNLEVRTVWALQPRDTNVGVAMTNTTLAMSCYYYVISAAYLLTSLGTCGVNFTKGCQNLLHLTEQHCYQMINVRFELDTYYIPNNGHHYI